VLEAQLVSLSDLLLDTLKESLLVVYLDGRLGNLLDLLWAFLRVPKLVHWKDWLKLGIT